MHLLAGGGGVGIPLACVNSKGGGIPLGGLPINLPYILGTTCNYAPAFALKRMRTEKLHSDKKQKNDALTLSLQWSVAKHSPMPNPGFHYVLKGARKAVLDYVYHHRSSSRR
jgi:hypothetical protein